MLDALIGYLLLVLRNRYEHGFKRHQVMRYAWIYLHFQTCDEHFIQGSNIIKIFRFVSMFCVLFMRYSFLNAAIFIDTC